MKRLESSYFAEVAKSCDTADVRVRLANWLYRKTKISTAWEWGTTSPRNPYFCWTWAMKVVG
jgi:hypothetical protein